MHMAIVRALGKRKSGMTRGDIIDATGTGSGRNITECLSELVQCGFLELYHSVEKAKSGGIYQLVDPYCLFYAAIASYSRLDVWQEKHILPKHARRGTCRR